MTHTVFCRKIYHADRLCPRLFTPHTLSNSDRISTMGATSCSMHGTARFQISDPFCNHCNSPSAYSTNRCSTIDSSHTPRTRMYVRMAEKGTGQRDKGGMTVPLHAHDRLDPHIHHLRARTPHSVEILATDGATIDPDDAHTPLPRPPCVFAPHSDEIHARRGRHHLKLAAKNLGSLEMPEK